MIVAPGYVGATTQSIAPHLNHQIFFPITDAQLRTAVASRLADILAGDL
jgi:hypothetical protein